MSAVPAPSNRRSTTDERLDDVMQVLGAHGKALEAVVTATLENREALLALDAKVDRIDAKVDRIDAKVDRLLGHFEDADRP